MNRSSFVSKLLTPVITLLVLAYFGYQIYGYVSDPFSATLAYTYQVEDTVDISGYVVRQEQVLTGESGCGKTRASGSAPAGPWPPSTPIRRPWTGRTRSKP